MSSRFTQAFNNSKLESRYRETNISAISVSPSTMSCPSLQPPNEDTITLTSNNFQRILDEFDEQGHIINSETRFQITCPICDEKELAILNGKFDKKSRASHESYAVLPHCQHAFGHTCVFSWIMSNINDGETPLCPSCRAPIFHAEDQATALEIFGDGDINEQHQDIINIRDSIKKGAEILFEDPVDHADSDSDSDWDGLELNADVLGRLFDAPQLVMWLREARRLINEEIAEPQGIDLHDELERLENAMNRYRILKDYPPPVNGELVVDEDRVMTEGKSY